MDNSQAMNGRWVRQLTESELRRILSTKGLVAVEWGWAGQTYLRSDRFLAIIRTGIMGGDVRDVHGGWRYPNEFSLLMDWQEIEYMGSKRTPLN